MHLNEIETPALIIDADIMERNLRTMQEWAKKTGVGIRAHFKTPKTPIISWKEIEFGAKGVCSQKVSEAEVVAMAGIKDILVTNEIVEPSKIDRLLFLNRNASVKVIVDSKENVKALAEHARAKGIKLGVLVELNVGANRTGVLPGKEALDLANEVRKYNSLEFKGLQAYAGHLQLAEHKIGREKKLQESEKVCEMISTTKDMIEDAGIEVEMVTGAGTGTYSIQSKVLTEVQPGSYPLGDWRYKVSAPEFDISLSVLTTVTSKPSETRAIVDAGLKSLSTDNAQPKPKDEALSYQTGSDEHGTLTPLAEGTKIPYRLGEKLEIYPSHCCTTINLHDRFYVVRKGELEAIWPITARGKCQ